MSEFVVSKSKMQKVIEFLKDLDDSKFNFREVVSDFDREHSCGTVCCVVGWFPSIFPEVIWVIRTGKSHNVGVMGTKIWGYAETAAEILGLDETVADYLFCPDDQNGVHKDLTDCGVDSSPEQVAVMLEQFIELVEAGEIEDHEMGE